MSMYNYELLFLIVMKCPAILFEFLLWFGCLMAPGFDKAEMQTLLEKSMIVTKKSITK